MKKVSALNGVALATLLLGVLSNVVAAQQAVTVSGHVTASGRPLAGARVRVDALQIDRTTDRTGYYSFIIPSNRVGGQTAVMTASFAERRVQYAPQSVEIALTGGAIVRDFDLRPSTDVPVRNAEPNAAPRPLLAMTSDTGANVDLSNAMDVPSALAGQFANLSVVTAPTLGGSTLFAYRGIRSLLGSAQPLFVVNGVVQDNSSFTSSAQRFGLGGFDYGSPLQDIDPRDVASVRWLGGSDAASRFGGRGANGAVIVTTKDASDGPRFAVGATHEVLPGDVVRLPALQNSYGQGLGGQFQFFDGRGGGINDAVDQNWGPPLDGRPLAQASYTEPRQADVRFWTPRPNNVRDFFRGATSTTTNATIQAQSDRGAVWFGVGQQQNDGVVPESALRRRNGRLSLSAHPSALLSLSGSVAIAEMKNDDAPGTGFNQGNPVSQFTRMGRQVDIDSLRAHVRTASGEQISWNYAGQNNPYFAALANDNNRDRNHASGSISATYSLKPSLTATASGGTDYYRDDRHFSIAPGWMGGYPFFARMGDFSRGGFGDDRIAAQRSNGALRFDGTRNASSTQWAYSFGGDFATIHQRVRSSGVDSVANVPAAGAPDDATIPAPVSWTGKGKTNALFGGGSVSFNDVASIALNLRQEWVSLLSGYQTSQTYPSVRATWNAGNSIPFLQLGGALDAVALHAAWWRAGNDATPNAIETIYDGSPVSGAIAPAQPGLANGAEVGPETTSAWEVGANVTGFGRHADAGISLYYDRTSNIILPRIVGSGTTPTVVNSATMRNHGVEGSLSVRGGEQRNGFGWQISGNAALNYNKVEEVGGGVYQIPLGPAQSGLSVGVVSGMPFGQLIGYKLRRDASGSLLLNDGLPMADTGTSVLGETRQNTIYGLQGRVGYRWITLLFAGDAHIGGSVFSTTTLNGDFAGTFAETAFRPDTGLLVRGVDVVTGQTNTTHVTTEAYYHALGGIQEPWVFDASYAKLRELSLTVDFSTAAYPRLPFESASLSLVARNVYTWSHSSNFDPEVLLSVYPYPGMELGQLPLVRSFGLRISIVP